MRDRTEEETIAHMLGDVEGEVVALKSELETLRQREQQYLRIIETLTGECKRAEEALSENRERVALAERAAGVGFFDWDIASNKAVWSPQLEAIFGLHPGEGSTELWPKLVHPDDLERAIETHRRCFRERCPEIHGDYRIIRPSGEVRWVEGRGVVIYDATGTPLRMTGAFLDITERKRAGEILHESEARSRSEAAELEFIYRTAPVGLCVLDSELRYVRINERLAEMNGVPVEAHLGKTFQEIVPEVVSDAEPLLQRVLETGEPLLGVEVRGRTAADPGQQRYWKEHFWPLKNGGGRVVGINVVVEEITERKRLEESLRREYAFRTLAENSTDVIVRYDRNLTRVYANPALEAVLGKPREAILGKRNREVGVPPDLADAWDNHLHRAFATKQERTMEFWVPTPGGRRYLQSRLIPEFNDRGEVETLLGITRDLTRNKQVEEALRDSEERYRRMVETANEGIWVIDTQTRTLLANHRMAEILGCTIEDVKSHGVLDFVYEDDRAFIQRHIDANFGGASEQFDFRFRRLDGSPAHLLGCTSAVTDATGRVVGALGMFTDISRRKLAEEALLQSQARWKSLFHDAPFPIWEEDFSAIRSRFEELRAKGVEDVETHLEAHPEETAHLAGLVKILDISRSTLETFGVSSVIDLSRSLPEYFDARSLEVFAKEMVALWKGETSFASEIPIRHPAGETRHLELHLSVVPGFERTLERVLVSFVDITGRKRADEAMRRREQEFRALAERSLDVVARVGRDLRYRYVNPAVEGVSGLPPDFFIDKAIGETGLPAEIESLFVEQIEAVFAGGEDRRFNFSVDDFLGKKRVFDTRVVPEFGPDGTAETVISVTREITRLYEAEEQARRTVKQLEAVNELLATQSRTDSLTGLANRRYLFDYLDNEWRRETRRGDVISLIVADVDFFKAYNDHYGHLAGDECLRHVAEVLRGEVHRPGDLLARYGGEEFVVVLPETPLRGAREMAEGMRRAVMDLHLEHQQSAVASHVTVSLGVAELAPQGHMPDDLFKLADAALYRAKENGRNRVEFVQA